MKRGRLRQAFHTSAERGPSGAKSPTQRACTAGERRDAQRGRLGRGALHAPPPRHPRGLRHDLSQKLRRLAARRGARAGQQFRSTPSVTSRASRRMTHDARRTACARPHRFPQPLYRANGRRGCCGRWACGPSAHACTGRRTGWGAKGGAARGQAAARPPRPLPRSREAAQTLARPGMHVPIGLASDSG